MTNAKHQKQNVRTEQKLTSNGKLYFIDDIVEFQLLPLYTQTMCRCVDAPF